VAEHTPTLILRRIRLAHCKRGPDRCETCRAWDVGRWCLLDVSPSDPGMVQRRVIEVELEGELQWREYDVVRAFDDEAAARSYVAAEGLPLADG